MAVHKVMAIGPRIGVRAVATDAGYAIIGTSLATYGGFVEAIGLDVQAGGIAPPVRCEVNDIGYGTPTFFGMPPDGLHQPVPGARRLRPRLRGRGAGGV